MNVCAAVAVSVWNFNNKKGNATSTKARLAPGSCTVEYKQMDMCILCNKQQGIWGQSVQFCLARPKPNLFVMIYLACYTDHVAILTFTERSQQLEKKQCQCKLFLKRKLMSVSILLPVIVCYYWNVLSTSERSECAPLRRCRHNVVATIFGVVFLSFFRDTYFSPRRGWPKVVKFCIHN